MPAERIGFVVGDQVDCETMVLVKDLAAAIGTANVDCRQDGTKLTGAERGEYLFNTTIAGIEQADACLLIGTNPRHEAPLVNARLRKRQLRGGFPVGRIGEPFDLTYPVVDIGAGAPSLHELLDGKHSFAEVLKKAERPMLILGQGPLTRAGWRGNPGRWRRQLAERFGDGRGRLERLQRAAHGSRPGRRARARPGARATAASTSLPCSSPRRWTSSS